MSRTGKGASVFILVFLHDQASNWLERLPAGSIFTWEDFTTRFLVQFFPLGRNAKLQNDILMFQQHQGESLSKAWTRFKDLLQKVPHHGINLWLQVQIFYDHVNPATRRTIDQSAGGKLRDKNAEKSWALLEDLALYDNESWNNPWDFAKPVKAISFPQVVPSTSDRRLIELENQVQCLMEPHLALKKSIQVNKIASSCEICSSPHTHNIAWKTPNKILLITHIRIITKWEVIFEKFNDLPAHDNTGDSMARVNAIFVYHPKSDAPPRKGIKSLSKLLSPKYQSQPCLGEQDKGSSSPKHVYFINTITVIRKEDEYRETGTTESDAAEYICRNTIVEVEKEAEEGLDGSKPEIEEDESRNIKRNDLDDRAREDTMEEEEVEEESEGSKEETKEEEEDDPEYFNTFPTIEELGYHEWLLENS
ncbi:MAK10-like protein [Tanacetum coccineum]